VIEPLSDRPGYAASSAPRSICVRKLHAEGARQQLAVLLRRACKEGRPWRRSRAASLGSAVGGGLARG